MDPSYPLDKRLHDDVPLLPPDAPYNGELQPVQAVPPPEFRTGLRAPWATAPGARAPPPPPPFVRRGDGISPRAAAAPPPASDPAVGSHFPQLARPLGGGATTSAAATVPDVMSPTTAPWAAAAAAAPPPPPFAAGRTGGLAAAVATTRPGGGAAPQSGQLRTGAPVAAVVDAQPAWPEPLLSARLAGGWELEAAAGEGATAAAAAEGGSGDGGDGEEAASASAAAGAGSLKWPTPADRDEESRLVRALRPPACKRILSEADLRRWLASPHARAFVGFVLSLNAACAGRSLAEPLRRPTEHQQQLLQQQQQQSAGAGSVTGSAASPAAAASSSAAAAGLMPPPPPHPPHQHQHQHQHQQRRARAAEEEGQEEEDDTPSPAVAALVRALDELDAQVDAHPPLKREAGALRYGNPAYREWHAAMSQRAERLLAPVLPPAMRRLAPRAAAAALGELAPYWRDSFGNATRIDYGTGHETCFVALLYCLARLGAFRSGREGAGAGAAAAGAAGAGAAAAAAGPAAPSSPRRSSDAPALVGVVFARYLSLMRRVQTTYWLEPAGSHGVWGLDDYQFLPFVWGASQLAHHPLVRPKSIHNDELMAQHGRDYLYLSGVQFVKVVKKGPLHETSPILNDISGVPTWTKVNQGLIKMYQVEVLSKFPIMQHFLFGGLLRFENGGDGGGDNEGGEGGEGMAAGEAAGMTAGRWQQQQQQHAKGAVPEAIPE